MDKRPATSALQEAILEKSSSPKRRRVTESSSSTTCQCLIDFPLIEWDFDDHDVSRERMDLLRSLPPPSLYSAMVRSMPFKTDMSPAALLHHPSMVASAYALHKHASSSDTSAILHLFSDQLRVSSK